MLVFWLVIGPLSVLAARRRGDSAGAKSLAFIAVSVISGRLGDLTSGADILFDFVTATFGIVALVYVGKSLQAQRDKKQAVEWQNEDIEGK